MQAEQWATDIDIILKFRYRACMAWSVFRFITAIIVALIVGELAAIPAAFFIDIVAGADVTGGRWPLNVPNVVWVCFKGLVVGCVAGSIAKKRGMLVAALANFVLLLGFTIATLIVNRDPTEYIATMYDTHRLSGFGSVLRPR